MSVPDKGESNYLPAAVMVPLYQSRLDHAYENLKFWQGEYAGSGDSIAEVELREARRAVGVLADYLFDLKTPGAVVAPRITSTPV